MFNNLSGQQTHSEASWRALGYFNLYRFLVAFLFVALIWIGQLPEPLGITSTWLFTLAAHADLLFSIAFGFFINLKSPRYNLQVAGQVLFDICIISLMMYASSGLNSGFGMLLVITVAGGSILTAGRIAILFAAIATIVVICQELYVKLVLEHETPNYTHVAFLGITFFFTALLGHALARRVRETEALADQRASDLERLSQLNEHIVQRLQSGIIVLDEEMRVRLVNESARLHLGLTGNVYNRPIAEIAPLVSSVLSKWKFDENHRIFIIKSGISETDLQISVTQLQPATRSGILVFLEDIAPMRLRAQQMKLASLGRLAASIAHEVRNPLGAIFHAGQLLSESAKLNQEDARLVQIIKEHSQRVNAIIENVQKISKREPASRAQVEFKPYLEKFINDFTDHHQLPPTTINLKMEADDMVVLMDESQLYQVMWNLCDNALRYSGNNPLIELRGGMRPDTQRPFLDIMDHGPGIQEDVLDNLFEPFFTTNPKGSGLGLYIARELCEANEASLSLHENSSMGCCFRIYFTHVQKQISKADTI